MSQGAVRAALLELTWMGFLETTPYSGTYVKSLSADDLQEIYPVRAALEALGARLTAAQLDALQHLVDGMLRVSKAGDERGMVERNFAFRRDIIHASGNATLIRAWSMFQFSYWTSVATAELHDDHPHPLGFHLEYLGQHASQLERRLRRRVDDQAVVFEVGERQVRLKRGVLRGRRGVGLFENVVARRERRRPHAAAWAELR